MNVFTTEYLKESVLEFLKTKEGYDPDELEELTIKENQPAQLEHSMVKESKKALLV